MARSGSGVGSESQAQEQWQLIEKQALRLGGDCSLWGLGLRGSGPGGRGGGGLGFRVKGLRTCWL